MAAYAFILAAAVFTILTKFPAVIYVVKRKGYYNNYNPRLQFQEDKTVERLYAAHSNTIESFVVFSVGMLVAAQYGLSQAQIVICGSTYFAARFAYMFCYIKNLAWTRSSFWFLGWLASLAPIAMAMLKL
ncbi:MAG: MAPEG family protein [Pseudobacteriovorax sp.]|nr:MAPEG family protein [Pseudobacteriovorax sp.]